MTKTTKLLIAGYHGFGNCGDEAILQAMVKNIRALPVDLEITALSKKPDFTKTEYNVNSVQRFDLFGVLGAILKSDVVLSGGGTLLQDGTSTRSLLYYLSIIKTAKLFGKRVMVYANGIGPVNGARNRKLVKKVLTGVDVITLREKLSEADLRSIGVTRDDVTVTADPAFTLESADDVRASEIFADENIPLESRKMVGVSVRAWNKAKYGDDFVVKLAKTCDTLAKQGKTIVLLPMEYPRDLEISQKLIDNMQEKAYIFKKRYNPSEILGLVGCFDLMISMRLHTLIFAAVKNVPMLGIIYDPKVEYYLRELDMPEAGDVRTKRLNSDEIAAKAVDVFKNMDAYKQKLKTRADIMSEKARENDKILLELIKKNEK
ncbi:MAG: polysaccharide pyruvyl transferase CsaB [Firmicutes bacterium]|nr:polysaccharide pyruvyl transferase CsaB [Bacillota bacterium]